MALRFSRLEQLLGAHFSDVSEGHLQRLVDGLIPEDVDFDFKQQIYGRSDQAKRDLSGDISAFANTVGGLVLIGISEDGAGRAQSLSPIQLPGDEIVRMHQVIATNVAPVPAFEIRELPSTATPGHSYLLAGVPLSPYRPHGVRVGDGFRFPVRDGPRIRYLSEPELADLYRGRFLGVRDQIEQTDRVEAEGVENLAPDGSWLTLSIVPRSPGNFPINQDTVEGLRSWVTSFALGESLEEIFSSPPQANAGVQRVVLANAYQDDLASEEYAEFHSDGSIFVAHRVGHEGWPADFQAVPDENLVLSLVPMVALSGRFIVEEAHSGGDALARANLYLPMTSDSVQPNVGIRLVHFRGFGNRAQEWPRGRPFKSPLRLTHTINLDVLSGARDLVITVRTLLTEIFHAFGVAEVPQLTREGQIRRQYFISQRQQALGQWATREGLEVVDDTLR